MYRAFILCLAAGLLVAPPTQADEVHLQDGRILIGIDLQRIPGGYQFTVDDGRRVLIPEAQFVGYRKSRPDERVLFRGTEVTLRQKIKVLQRERAQQEHQAMENIERWGYGAAKDRALTEREEVARQAVQALPAEQREKAFRRALAGSDNRTARMLSAQQLVAFDSDEVRQELVRATITDREGDVRRAGLAALETLGQPDATAPHLADYLESQDPARRIRASEALYVLPSPIAVGPLVTTFRYVWKDFGKAYFYEGTERAYIKDWTLSSGGTGLTVIETADPEIGVLRTGVVLEAHVQRVEMVVRVRALHRITGQRFGGDVRAWEEWYASRSAAGNR